MSDEIKLVEPSVEYKDSYLSALEERLDKKEILDTVIADPGNDFAVFVKNLKDESLGINMKPGRVPQTTYWIIDKDGFAGRISVRHELNEDLLKLGGNIGYIVKLSKRRKGYATKALKLVLPKVRELGLKKVLLTCNNTNIASKKVIESAGGILENEVIGKEGEPNKLRYWIDL